MSGRSAVRSPGQEVDRAERGAQPAPLSPAAACVVALQQSAGNAAVTALISRDEAAPAVDPVPAPAPPPDKTGIASRLAVYRFIEAAKKIQAEWATMTTAKERGKALGAAANAELKAAGVPEAKVRVKKLAVSGEFDFATWTLDIGKAAFEAATPSNAEIMEATDTVYHEARHAEQWFRIARLQAGKGWKAPKIAYQLSIPLKIAKLAVASPLTGTSTDATEASSWYESVYGTGRKHRNKTLKALSKTREAVEKALAAFKKLAKNPKATEAKKEAARKKLEDAAKKRKEVYDAYRALPEEADAWSTGDDVQLEFLLYDRI